MTVLTLSPDDARYPPQLRERMGDAAPTKLSTLGNLNLPALPKTALFCSVRCPGHVILTAYDQAAKWRDPGRCVISGFHSPVGKECLRILLRGSQPIIICPARTLPQRVPPELAIRRNEFVAALADELWFAHITPGGQMDKLAQRARVMANTA
jgi:predicted Rossmann fold nucleotide-binding protein DprA/Smf involved in DNA uptake